MHGSALDALTQKHDRGHFHFSYIQHRVSTFSSRVNKPYVDFKKMLFCCVKSRGQEPYLFSWTTMVDLSFPVRQRYVAAPIIASYFLYTKSV